MKRKKRKDRKRSKEEIAAMLNHPECHRDADMSRRVRSDIFVLQDQVIFSKTRVVWDKAELERNLQQGATGESQHILAGLFLEDHTFPERTVALITAAAKALGVPEEKLDYSPDSVKRLDRVIDEDSARDPVIFAAAVAYLGEIIRRQAR